MQPREFDWVSTEISTALVGDGEVGEAGYAAVVVVEEAADDEAGRDAAGGVGEVAEAYEEVVETVDGVEDGGGAGVHCYE